MERAGRILAEAGEQFDDYLGRRYGPVEPYMMDDAEVVLVSAGSMTSNVRYAVRELRNTGSKVGLLRLVAFRPFPFAEIRQHLAGRDRVAVLDRNMSPGHSGIFAEEIRSALAGMPDTPDVYGYVIGIGGRDVRVDDVAEVVSDVMERDVPERCLYVGVKGLPITPVRSCSYVRPIAEVAP
jgi:pyruvate/2-oxoacid:ferredoxin oxidoreductase alpha subunit